jgi:hypothetical protein
MLRDFFRISSIVAWLKISREAMTAFISRTDGFESWKPAAPG